jgi:hypothetical protein
MDELLDYFTKMAARDCRGPIKFLKMSKATLEQIVQFSINFLNPMGNNIGRDLMRRLIPFHLRMMMRFVFIAKILLWKH